MGAQAVPFTPPFSWSTPTPSRMANTVHVTATTWTRDSHSLFDYESTKNSSQSFNSFSDGATFIRDRSGLVHMLPLGQGPLLTSGLCNVTKDAEGYFLVKSIQCR